MDGESQSLVHSHTKNPQPLEGNYPFYRLIETSGSNIEHDASKLEHSLEGLIGQGVGADGVLA